MILYIENPKRLYQKNLELINSLKLQDTKINTQKSVAFLCTNSKLSDMEIKKTIPFAIASKTIKYLGINLTKEVTDTYTKNSKTLMKEIEDTNKWKDFVLMDWKNIVKISVLPKPIYRFNAIPIKILMHFKQKQSTQF